PPDLETICLKCLQKEPRKRYGSALELAEDLHRFQLGEPIRARPVAQWERVLKWTRRRPAAAGFLTASVVALFSLAGGGMLYGLYKHQEARALEQEWREHQHQDTMRAKAEEQLRQLQEHVASRDWTSAKLQLSEVHGLVSSEPFLEDLKPQVDGSRQD